MKRNGFTLVEFVLIIAILGILATILIPLLQEMRPNERNVRGPINFYVEEQSYSYRVGMELKLKDPERKQKVDMEKLKEKVEKAVSMAVREVLEVKTEEERPRAEKPAG